MASAQQKWIGLDSLTSGRNTAWRQGRSSISSTSILDQQLPINFIAFMPHVPCLIVQVLGWPRLGLGANARVHVMRRFSELQLAWGWVGYCGVCV